MQPCTGSPHPTELLLSSPHLIDKKQLKHEVDFIFNFLLFLPHQKRACQLRKITATGVLHNLLWYVYFLCTYILVLQLSIFITIIQAEDVCMVLNKVARPAHEVENLPTANQKIKIFQCNYHPYSHVNVSFS